MGDTTQTSASFEDEPPLMEELGIDIHQIYQVFCDTSVGIS